MAGIGAELAGGASGVYDYLRQQIEDRIRQQMAQQQMALGVRGADRADRALDQQDELKRLQIQSTADAKAEAARGAEEGRVMRTVAMRPTGADVTQPEYQRETGYGMPSGLYTPKGIDEPQPPEGIAAPSDPKMITGRLQMMPDTVAGSPAPSQRVYRFKGTQAEADKQAELDRKTAHDKEQTELGNWKASITNDLANFKMSQPPSTTASDNRVDRSYQYHRSALDKIAKPLEDQQQRMGRLIESVNQQTPQADALVAPELLTVMAGGAGSGLRMNEAEISRIIGGRSKWQTLKATLDQWNTDPSKATSITPEQRGQIRQLVQAVHEKSQAALATLNQAGDSLIDTDVMGHRRVLADARKKLQHIFDAAGSDAPAATSGAPQAPAGWKYVPKPGGGWTAVQDKQP